MGFLQCFVCFKQKHILLYRPEYIPLHILASSSISCLISTVLPLSENQYMLWRSSSFSFWMQKVKLWLKIKSLNQKKRLCNILTSSSISHSCRAGFNGRELNVNNQQNYDGNVHLREEDWGHPGPHGLNNTEKRVKGKWEEPGLDCSI